MTKQPVAKPELTQAQISTIMKQVRIQNPRLQIKADYFDGMSLCLRLGRKSKWLFKAVVTLTADDLYEIVLSRVNFDFDSDEFGKVWDFNLTDDGHGGWYYDMLHHLSDYYSRRHKLAWVERKREEQ